MASESVFVHWHWKCRDKRKQNGVEFCCEAQHDPTIFRLNHADKRARLLLWTSDLMPDSQVDVDAAAAITNVGYNFKSQ